MAVVKLEGIVKEEFIVLGTHAESDAQVLECRVFFSNEPDDYEVVYRLQGSTVYHNKKLPLKKVSMFKQWTNRSGRR